MPAAEASPARAAVREAVRDDEEHRRAGDDDQDERGGGEDGEGVERWARREG